MDPEPAYHYIAYSKKRTEFFEKVFSKICPCANIDVVIKTALYRKEDDIIEL
jgi:hypothetical protein